MRALLFVVLLLPAIAEAQFYGYPSPDQVERAPVYSAYAPGQQGGWAVTGVSVNCQPTSFGRYCHRTFLVATTENNRTPFWTLPGGVIHAGNGVTLHQASPYIVSNPTMGHYYLNPTTQYRNGVARPVGSVHYENGYGQVIHPSRASYDVLRFRQ